MFQGFYAVTQTSLYHVCSSNEEHPHAHARKLAVRGDSGIPRGAILGEPGQMVEIRRWLQWFTPKGSSGSAERVNVSWWGGNTTKIVALFENEEEARRCFRSKKLACCDPRWVENTRRVIESIERDHPDFVVCRSFEYRLLPD